MPQKAQFVTGWFVPVDVGARPEHPIVIPPTQPGEPPTIWPSPGHPAHPIAPGGGAPVDPGYGVSIERPTHPIVIPPLPGIWPDPGKPTHPIVLPDPPPAGLVYIEGTPEKPVTSAAGTLQPPLPSGSLPPAKVALLVKAVGDDMERWLTYDNTPSVQPVR